METTSHLKSSLKDLLWQPLINEKGRLARIAVALLVLAGAQGGVLFVIKGFVTALFAPSSVATITLTELFPERAAPMIPAPWRTMPMSRVYLATIVPIALALAGLLKATASYFYQLEQQALALTVARNARERLFFALLNAPYLTISQRAIGDWMSIVMNDVLYLQARFSDLAAAILRHTVTIAACLAAMFIILPQAAVALVAIMPLIAIGMGATGRRIARYAEAFQQRLGALAATILSLRARFNFMRAQGGEHFEAARFSTINDEYCRLMRRSILVRSAFAPGLELFGFAVFATFVWVGGRRLLPGLTPETMLPFFAALGLLLRPLREIGEQAARFAETRGVLNRCLTVLAAPRAPTPDLGSPVGSLRPAAELNIARVVAGWGRDAQFDASKLTIHRGQAVAVIGPSGAGKSTLLKTLAGLIPPTCWQANLPWADTVDRTSMVSQDPFLFDDTIATNLAYGLPTAPTSDDIWKALKDVNMEQEAGAFPAGLATRIRSLAGNVSGGQLQRLVIARGLLRGKDLLLLDESMSAVDAAAERDISLRLIDACHRDKTMLLAVTHRLQWLDAYDEIWFIEAGRRLFFGRHEELMKEARYRDFCLAGGG